MPSSIRGVSPIMMVDDESSSLADDARARRRYELEQLKRMTRSGRGHHSSNNSVHSRTEDLLAKARDQLMLQSENSSTSSLTSAGNHPPPPPRIPRPPNSALSTIRIASAPNSVNSDISNSIDNRQFQWQQQQQQRQRSAISSNRGHINRNRVNNINRPAPPPPKPASQSSTKTNGSAYAPTVTVDRRSADSGAGAPPISEVEPKPISYAAPRRPSPIIPIMSERSTNSSRIDIQPKEKDFESMQRELKRVQQDKEDAYRQVVRLREQVQKMSATEVPEFQHLVEKADREGEQAALQWARQQVERSNSRKKSRGRESPRYRRPMFGFPSPARSGRTTSTMSPSRRALNGSIVPVSRKRTNTPAPRRQREEVSPELLALATRSNPDEYDSEVATYKIRRPYAPHDEESFWNEVGELSSEEYQAQASVQTSSSLEVAAVIKADKSVLLVFHQSDCRHKKKRAQAWRTFENVDERDQPLGSIMYIDTDANEGEYWLDEIFEEAMATRETYCSSLLSTVAALESNNLLQSSMAPTNITTKQPMMANQIPPLVQVPPVQQHQERQMLPPQVNSTIPPAIAQQQQQQQQSSDPPPLVQEQQIPGHVEKNREMEKQEKPIEAISEVAKKETVPPATKKTKAPPPEHAEEEANDLLSSMLGSLIYASVVLLYFAAVKVPLAILKFGVYAIIVSVFYWIVWLRYAEQQTDDILLGLNQVGIE